MYNLQKSFYCKMTMFGKKDKKMQYLLRKTLTDKSSTDNIKIDVGPKKC